MYGQRGALTDSNGSRVELERLGGVQGNELLALVEENVRVDYRRAVLRDSEQTQRYHPVFMHG